MFKLWKIYKTSLIIYHLSSYITINLINNFYNLIIPCLIYGALIENYYDSMYNALKAQINLPEEN